MFIYPQSKEKEYKLNVQINDMDFKPKVPLTNENFNIHTM